MRFIKATYHEPSKTAEYEAEDGTRLLRTGGTLNWRFNNPGNLTSAGSQPGKIGTGVVHNPDKHIFAIFSTVQAGENAKRSLLKNVYKDFTIPTMMEKYANYKDGNDPVAYAKFIMSESGVTEDQKVGELDEDAFNKVIAAIRKKEGGMKAGTEKWVYVTNITVSDGSRPVAGVPFKVTLDNTTYEWQSDEKGRLQTIVHTQKGMTITIKYTNSAGKEEIVYSAIADDETKNVLLTQNFQQFSAKTLISKPDTPREKSEQQPVDYTIMPGDSLSKIAKRYQTSVDDILKNNDIKDANKIYPGKRITLYGSGKKEANGPEKKEPNDPGKKEPNDPGKKEPNGSEKKEPNDPGKKEPNDPEKKEPKTYKIVAGDTLGKIAHRFNVSVYELAKLNGIINPDRISPGTEIDLPETATEAKKSDPAPKKEPVNVNTKQLESVAAKGSGEPIAILPHDQREAPWMSIAFEEGEKRWHWGKVKEANGGINYHAETGIKSIKTMVGDNNPWCAAFVNYCLKQAGYSVSGSSHSQSFANSKQFVKISQPIYGAIVVLRKKNSWKGHVAFIYCKTKDNDICVLGGNQKDSVTMNSLYNKYLKSNSSYILIGYYVPSTYHTHALDIINNGDDLIPAYIDIDDLLNYLGAEKLSDADNKTR